MFPYDPAAPGAPRRARIPGGNPMRRFWAALGSLLFFVIAPGTLAVYLPWSITGWHLKPPFLGVDALRIVGATLVFLGLVAIVGSFIRFVWKGFGTPAPVAPPTRLVVTGFYRRVRNPIYVGLIVISVGEALILGDGRMLVYAAGLWLFFHVWVLAIEEPSLGQSFGDEFATFKANVPRWLPRLTPWAGPAKDQAS
jgi:protein-S-isoprenylcysteine O-methyltransferase Ste14